MTETVRDVSTSPDMTEGVLDYKRTFWALAALMLVISAHLMIRAWRRSRR